MLLKHMCTNVFWYSNRFLCVISHQAPLSMGFPWQGYWRGLPFPSPGDLSNPGINPVSPALAGRFFTTESQGICNYRIWFTK